MKKIWNAIVNFVLKADLILLGLCVAASIFGIVMIASASRYTGVDRYVTIQVFALVLGVILYIIFSFLNIEYIAEKWELLFAFNVIFILLLLPFGEAGSTTNRSWIRPSFLPFGLQPAEICKITFILIMSHHMSLRRDQINSFVSIGQFLLHTIFIVGLIVFVSGDDGMALMYIVIFIFMAVAAGVRPLWFMAGAGLLGAAVPLIWNYMANYQKERILVILDPSREPLRDDVLYQTELSKNLIGSGQMFGQGYSQGRVTQSGSMPAQHTDFIFSVVGEELGYIGCVAVLVILTAIVIRCFYVGVKSNNYLNRLICSGIACMLLFQILINVGMCLGIFPVIGLTLPFMSYGGTSLFTMFAAMGMVSSIKMRPTPDRPVKYIHPGQYY